MYEETLHRKDTASAFPKATAKSKGYGIFFFLGDGGQGVMKQGLNM